MLKHAHDGDRIKTLILIMRFLEFAVKKLYLFFLIKVLDEADVYRRSGDLPAFCPHQWQKLPSGNQVSFIHLASFHSHGRP